VISIAVDHFAPDSEGSELADVTATFLEARAMARDFAIDDLRQRNIVADRLIEITNSRGWRIGTFRARDALEGDGFAQGRPPLPVWRGKGPPPCLIWRNAWGRLDG
jgi:hypothetical protein